MKDFKQQLHGYGSPDIIMNMHVAAQRRWEKTQPVTVDSFPYLPTIPTRVFVGTYTHTYPDWKIRQIRRDVSLNLFGSPQSPTELTRDYLTSKYTKPLRATGEQMRAFEIERPWPYHAEAGIYPDMVYVDLKSAYWSIVQAVGWDVEYLPGGYLGVRSDMTDFPLPGHRASRNALVSVGKTSGAVMWTGSEYIKPNGGNRLKNLGLFSLVMDVLNGLAFDIMRLGAVYIHTDGYIIPASCLPAAYDVIESWGLVGRVKHEGDAVVYGVGSYSMGGHKTDRTTHTIHEQRTKITPHNSEWLKKSFRWAAERQPFFYGKGDPMNQSEYGGWTHFLV